MTSNTDDVATGGVAWFDVPLSLHVSMMDRCAIGHATVTVGGAVRPVGAFHTPRLHSIVNRTGALLRKASGTGFSTRPPLGHHHDAVWLHGVRAFSRACSREHGGGVSLPGNLAVA